MTEDALRGSVVVITGASSGFGQEAARAFAKAGADVVVADRREDLIERLAEECRGHGVRALALATDVSIAEDVADLAQRAIVEMGRIDVWVNHTGSGALGRFEDIPLQEHQRIIGVNLLGTLYGSWQAVRHFVQRGRGTLINVASEPGRDRDLHDSSGVAARYGIVGLCAAIRRELVENGYDDIQVCCRLPEDDMVETILRLARHPKDGAACSSEWRGVERRTGERRASRQLTTA